MRPVARSTATRCASRSAVTSASGRRRVPASARGASASEAAPRRKALRSTSLLRGRPYAESATVADRAAAADTRSMRLAAVALLSLLLPAAAAPGGARAGARPMLYLVAFDHSSAARIGWLAARARRRGVRVAVLAGLRPP